MAIDSALKRFSIAQFGHELDFLLIPDGTIAAEDRALLLCLYSGITLSGAVVNPYLFYYNSRRSRSLGHIQHIKRIAKHKRKH